MGRRHVYEPEGSLTAEDVLDLPLLGGISGYELVGGRPVPVMPASRIQRRLIVTAAYVLETHVREHGLSGEIRRETGFVLGLRHDPERMRAPDVAYVECTKIDANPDPGRPERLLRCAPDLAVEIDLTFIDAFNRPGLARKSGGQRRKTEYLEAGTRLIWAIDSHTRTATVHRAKGAVQRVHENEVLDGEEVVPGLRLLLADLFDL